MAAFLLTLACDNAAFVDDTGVELNRILKQVAADVLNPERLNGYAWTLRDVNGNTIGRWTYTP